MKKIIKTTSIIVMAAMLLASCNSGSASGAHVQSTTTGVAEVMASRMAEEDGTESETTPSESTAAPTVVAYGSCDIDLTTMNADLVYANVYSIVSSPESFIGTSIRMSGTALSSTDEATGITYHACFIADAAGCCSAGLEYQLSDGYYPEDGEEITILGTFEVYEEDGNPYVILDNSVREF